MKFVYKLQPLTFASLLKLKYVVVVLVKSCLTVCDPMDCNPPGSFVHEVLQARESCYFFLHSTFVCYTTADKFSFEVLLPSLASPSGTAKAMTDP